MSYTPNAYTSLYLKFDGDTQDYSGNGNHGTPNTTPTYVDGKFHKAFACNNSTNITGDLNCNGITERTVSQWLKRITNTGTTYDGIFNSGTISENHFIDMYIYQGNGYFTQSAYTGGKIEDTNHFPGGTVNVVCVYRNGGRSNEIYINGIQVASGNLSWTPSGNGYIIGRNGSNAIREELIVEDRAWTQADINNYLKSVGFFRTLYMPTSSTKLLVDLNGESLDRSGNSNHGVNTNIGYTNGQFGQCATFNGSSSKIAFSDSGLNTGNGTRTMMMWVYPTNLGYKQMFCSYGSFSNNLLFAFLYDSGAIQVYAYDNDYNSGVSLSQNVWQHIAVTFDGAVLVIYVNGKEVARDSRTYNTVSSGNLWLGSFQYVNYFSGNQEHFIFENRALSGDEIRNYYLNSLGKFNSIII